MNICLQKLDKQDRSTKKLTTPISTSTLCQVSPKKLTECIGNFESGLSKKNTKGTAGGYDAYIEHLQNNYQDDYADEAEEDELPADAFEYEGEYTNRDDEDDQAIRLEK